MEFNFAQGVGLLGFLIGVTALLHKSDDRLRLQLALFTAVMAVHFLMMGAFTAAIGSFISCARSYVSTRTHSTTVMVFFIALLWGLGLYTLQAPFELVTLVGTSVATYGLFKTRGMTTRWLLMFNTLCWLTNNLIIGSMGGILAESSFFIVNLWVVYQMWLTNRPQNESVG